MLLGTLGPLFVPEISAPRSHGRGPEDRGLSRFLFRCLREWGSGGSEFLDCDLLFRAEPIFQLVTVFSAPFLVQFERAQSDLIFEFELL